MRTSSPAQPLLRSHRLAITHGSQVSAVVKVSSVSGTPTGNVSINALAANGSVQNGTLQNGSYSRLARQFPGRRLLGSGPLRRRRYLRPERLELGYAHRQSRVECNYSCGRRFTTPSSGTTASIGNGASLAYGGIPSDSRKRGWRLRAGKRYRQRHRLPTRELLLTAESSG